MPYRESTGKIDPERKAALLNIMARGTDVRYIVNRGEVIQVNLKELFDERPDL